jgi:hypothetical protein
VFYTLNYSKDDTVIIIIIIIISKKLSKVISTKKIINDFNRQTMRDQEDILLPASVATLFCSFNPQSNTSYTVYDGCTQWLKMCVHVEKTSRFTFCDGSMCGGGGAWRRDGAGRGGCHF